MDRLTSEYAVGFFGETGAAAKPRIALPNNSFNYVFASIPTVASDIPSHRWLAHRARPALSLDPVDSAEGLAAATDDLLGDDGATLARAREHAYALGQRSSNLVVEKGVLVQEVEEVTSWLL